MFGHGRRPVVQLDPAVPVDVDAHPAAGRLALAGQVRAEPVERFGDHGGDALCHQLGVSPRPDGQRHRDTAPVQLLVLLQGLVQEQVLPPAQQQDGHLDMLQSLIEPQLVPERVVALGMFQPGFEPRCTVAQQLTGRGSHRQSGGGLGQLGGPAQLPGEGLHHARLLLAGHHRAPAQEVVEAERSGAPRRCAEIVRSDGDDGGLHLRRGIGQQRPLGEAEIGQAHGGERSGEPGLVAQPGHGVGAVGHLVDHRGELAARAECAAHTLQHHVVAARRVYLCEQR
nr:hypothetical protein CPGR_03578 [Mycolicibacterium fortuitum subsp. fortuitum DSM 46621 = ATCC 6841 = JCM 6387]